MPHVRSFVLTCLLGAACPTLFAQAPYGVHPRPAATDYAVNRKTGSATFAASVVPATEVRRIFAVDISKTYVVLEVACYPDASASIALAGDDFLVKSGQKSEFVHPADAVTVASVIQQKNTPPAPSTKPVSVVTTASAGYESGTDPYTGRRIHGTYTDVGTAVQVGGPDNMPPMPPAPGSTSYDRMTLQQQLEERAFPAGNFSSPVAGFLYFPVKQVKGKNGVFELEYLASGSGPVRLPVPSSSR